MDSNLPNGSELSLRQVLAYRGIESSTEIDRKREMKRFERRLAALAANDAAEPHIPGVEVTYLEIEDVLLQAA